MTLLKNKQQLLAMRKRKIKNYAMEKLVKVLQQQIASRDCRYEEQQRRYEEQLQILIDLIRERLQDGDQELPTTPTTAVATTNFFAFDSTSELWSDYWSRFCTFANAHSVPKEKSAKVFLTNQTSTTYKML